MEQKDGDGSSEAAGGRGGSQGRATGEECQNLLELPTEIQEMIFLYLNEATIFRILPQVCKQVRALIAADEFVRGRIGREAASLLSRRLRGQRAGSPSKAESAAERVRVSNFLNGCALFPVLPERAVDRDQLFRARGAAAADQPPSFEKAAALVIGCRVTISGVVSKPQLNGAFGTVKMEDRKKTGRWAVQLDGADAVISFHLRNLVQVAAANFRPHCFARPLPETRLRRPGTLDLARGLEAFPISVNTSFITAETTAPSRRMFISALPDALVPWTSVLASCRSTDGSEERRTELNHVHTNTSGSYLEGKDKFDSYIEGLVARSTRVKLCGLEMNGKYGTVVGQRNRHTVVHHECLSPPPRWH